MTYFLTIITVSGPQTSDMRQIRHLMSALPVASARFSKLLILRLNDLLDAIYVKKNIYIISDIYIFSFFPGF